MPTDTVAFSFELMGAGSAVCVLAVGGQKITLYPSYLSDALGPLLGAVARVLDDQDESHAAFTDEPGEDRWWFRRVWPDQLRVQVLRFNETFSSEPDELGTVTFDAVCPLPDFASAVCRAAERVLSDHGREGYLKEWRNHEFPADQLARLRALLDRR
jgi:hypothetical protein